jgi:hypothetical protein
MDDQDFLKCAVSGRADISLHHHAIEVLAIAIGIARREIVVNRHQISLARTAPVALSKNFVKQRFDVRLVWQSSFVRLPASEIEVRFRHAEGDIPRGSRLPCEALRHTALNGSIVDRFEQGILHLVPVLVPPPGFLCLRFEFRNH